MSQAKTQAIWARNQAIQAKNQAIQQIDQHQVWYCTYS